MTGIFQEKFDSPFGKEKKRKKNRKKQKNFQKGLDKRLRIWYNNKVASAGMAQSVEHVIGNDEVISSILITSSIKAIQLLRTQAVHKKERNTSYGQFT